MKKVVMRCAAFAVAVLPAVAPAGPVAAPRPYVSPSPAQLQQAYDAYRHPFQQPIPQVVPPQPSPEAALPTAPRQLYCVASTVKVGDVVRSKAGNTAAVKALSDAATVCHDPAQPVGAELEYQEIYSPKLEFALPDSFTLRTPSDLRRFQGEMFWAHDVGRDVGLHVYARPRRPGDSARAYVRGIAASVAALLDEPKSGDPELVAVNGVPALCFEVEGRVKGSATQRRTYVETVIDSPVELVLVETFTPSAKADDNRPLMQRLAAAVRGIGAPVAALDVPKAPQTSAPAGESGVKPSGSPGP